MAQTGSEPHITHITKVPLDPFTIFSYTKTNDSIIYMADQFSQNDPHVDPYAYLGLVRNPDGSITRVFEFPTVSPSSDPRNVVLTKDISINEAKKTWVRIFLPRQAIDSSNVTKLPLIVDFHGGGFVICSAATSFINSFYTIIINEIPAIMVSVEYRRAPEHRLPAAYDDCMEALYWIKNSNEEWLISYADFSCCFLFGNSAGGNIAYHVGLRASTCVDDLKPLHIKGLILNQPFFGGTKRTQSELRLVNDKSLPPCLSDILWELSLPIGADRDHEYSNPMVGINTHLLDQIRRLGWKILVTGCDGDPLSDRLIEFCRMLEENNLQVVGKFEEGGFHGLELLLPVKTKAFSRLIKEALILTDYLV